jgi:hypothetical protein
VTVVDAKANGVKFGRKPKLTPHQKREAIKRRDQEPRSRRRNLALDWPQLQCQRGNDFEAYPSLFGSVLKTLISAVELPACPTRRGR